MPAPKKNDPDKADEQTLAGAPLNAAQPVAGEESEAPTKPGKLSAKALRDARFIGGAWVDANGRPYTDAETRQIHQARDAEALAERQKALLGGG